MDHMTEPKYLYYHFLVLHVVSICVITNVSLVPLVQRTLFLCLRHDKFEICVINVSQHPTALLFASRWAPKYILYTQSLFYTHSK